MSARVLKGTFGSAKKCRHSSNHGPNTRQVVFVESTLAKDFESSLTADETRVLSVPGPKDGVVALLLCFGESPGHPWGCSSSLSLVVLLEGLLERETACELL